MPIDKQILQRLQSNDSMLTELDLRYQDLMATDMQELVKALSSNQTLTTLNVGYNQIGAEGAKALSSNQTLTMLYVNNNQIGEEWETALKQRIKANQALALLAKHFSWGQGFHFFKAKSLTRNQETYPSDVTVQCTL